jgi:membrane protease subunit (stomatin/prohibitin family)
VADIRFERTILLQTIIGWLLDKGVVVATKTAVFLEILEWFDPTGSEMAQRLPETGSGEIKYGAQLVVRESQAAVFFYGGRAIHAFGPGRHTLKTGNIPILTKILSIPWGMNSPLRAEVYFCNTKVFTNQKWGTRDPVAFKDSELGLIRLRAFGFFNVQVVQPLLFINFLVGTVGNFSTADIEEYFSNIIVSRFNDHLGNELDTILSLPGRYDELADGLKRMLQQDFSHFGLSLPHLYISSITPPVEVQKAIDDRSRLGAFEDLNKLMKLKAAMALEKAAANPGGAGEGMGLGMGFMMPAMLSHQFQVQQGRSSDSTQSCPDCKQQISQDARFCPYCGHQILVFSQCEECGKNLPPTARFCVRCGHPAAQPIPKKKCTKCGAENLPKAEFCNQCGERI